MDDAFVILTEVEIWQNKLNIFSCPKGAVKLVEQSQSLFTYHKSPARLVKLPYDLFCWRTCPVRLAEISQDLLNIWISLTFPKAKALSDWLKFHRISLTRPQFMSDCLSCHNIYSAGPKSKLYWLSYNDGHGISLASLKVLLDRLICHRIDLAVPKILPDCLNFNRIYLFGLKVLSDWLSCHSISLSGPKALPDCRGCHMKSLTGPKSLSDWLRSFKIYLASPKCPVSLADLSHWPQDLFSWPECYTSPEIYLASPKGLPNWRLAIYTPRLTNVDSV